jgi:hypothetical protein
MPLTPMPVEDLRRVVNIGTTRKLSQATGDHHDKHELLAVMHETNFTEPFDWSDWIATFGAEKLNDPALLDTADLDTLRRLVTAHVRMDRFSGGHLDTILASGYMDRAMARARQLLEQSGGTGTTAGAS